MSKEISNMLIGKVGKNRIKLMFSVVVIAVVLIITGLIFYKGYSSAQEKYEETITKLLEDNKNLQDDVKKLVLVTKEVDISYINSEIQNIGELATVEYLYTNAGKFEDDKKLFDIKVPFTTKYFIAKWDGIIKAGIDITKVVAEAHAEEKKIVVYIPKAQILSHEIDEKSIETLDEKEGMFNRLTVENTREFDAVCKEDMEQRAVENGLLEKALENAKGIISRLICTDTVVEQGYSVEFKLLEK